MKQLLQIRNPAMQRDRVNGPLKHLLKCNSIELNSILTHHFYFINPVIPKSYYIKIFIRRMFILNLRTIFNFTLATVLPNQISEINSCATYNE